MSTVMPTPNDESNVKRALKLGLVPVRLARNVTEKLNPINSTKELGEQIETFRDINAARRMTKPMRKQIRQQQKEVIRKMGHDYRQQQAAAKAQAKIKEAEIERFEEELPGVVFTLPKH